MRLPFQILLFFVMAQAIGLYTGGVLLQDMPTNPYIRPWTIGEDANAPENAVYLFGFILVGAAVLIVLIRYFGKWQWIFRTMEFFLIASASSMVFYALARATLGYAESMAIGIAVGLGLGILKGRKSEWKNVAAILATAGVGAAIGASWGIVPVMILMGLLAVYDYLAVFITKHMVQMAEFLISQNLAFTVTARTDKTGKEKKQIDLGTGDLVVPLMLEVAVLPLGVVASLTVMTGAIAALSLFLFLVWEKRMVLPAIPPIAAGSLIFFILGGWIGIY